MRRPESTWVGSERLWLAVLVVIMAGYAWVGYRWRFMLLNPLRDTWVHLAYIRRTMEGGCFPGDAFYAGLPTPPYYSLEHMVLAGVSTLTGAPPHVIWLTLPPLIAIVIVGAAYVWLRALTGDARIAVAGAAAELFVQAPDPAWLVLPYPRAVSLPLLALALFCYLRGRQRNRLDFLVLAGLALGVCAGTHLYVGAFCLLGLLFLELALAPAIARRSPWLLVTVVTGLLVSAPWVLNALHSWRLRQTLVPQTFDATGEVWRVSAGPLTFSMFRPTAIVDALPPSLWPLAVVGLACCAWRSCRRRATLADRYALLATAGTLMLLLTPIFGVLASVAGVWTRRMIRVVPFPLLVGLAATGTADLIRSCTRPYWRRSLAIAVVLLGLWVAREPIRNLRTPLPTWARGANAFTTGGPLGNWQFAAQVAASGPLPRVVLSDTWTSYLLPYYLGCSVVAIPDGHGSPYVDHSARAQAVARVYDPHTPLSEIRAILDRYGVDMLAVSRQTLWEPQRTAQGRALVERLRHEQDFVDTGCCGSLTLLRYQPRPRDE